MTYRELLDDVMSRYYRSDYIYRQNLLLRKMSETNAERERIETQTRADNKSGKHNKQNMATGSRKSAGSLLHINIPPDTAMNLSDLIELSSPSGISLDVKLSFLKKHNLDDFIARNLQETIESLKKAGAKIEFV